MSGEGRCDTRRAGKAGTASAHVCQLHLLPPAASADGRLMTKPRGFFVFIRFSPRGHRPYRLAFGVFCSFLRKHSVFLLLPPWPIFLRLLSEASFAAGDLVLSCLHPCLGYFHRHCCAGDSQRPVSGRVSSGPALPESASCIAPAHAHRGSMSQSNCIKQHWIFPNLNSSVLPNRLLFLCSWLQSSHQPPSGPSLEGTQAPPSLPPGPLTSVGF